MPTARVFTVFHPAPTDESFDQWVQELSRSASAATGFVEIRSAVRRTGDLDWAIAVTFDSENDLHDWLDSPDHHRVFAAGAQVGVLPKTTDLVVVTGTLPPTGVSLFEHSVADGKDSEFISAQMELTRRIATFPGFEGTVVFPPATDGHWVSMVRFRTGHQLSRWLQSQERAEALPGLRANLTEDFTEVSQTTPFGSVVRVENGETKVTPNWKSAMIVLLVLYPTVMILSRFVGPIFDHMGADPGLALFLSQILSVGLMTYFFMPWVSAGFAKWLDPFDGAGARISIIGAVVVVALYAAILALFLSVKWLQFWDYND